jgi:NADH:ubiquinone oxidoreductase subunit 3 (subunit A)
VFAPHNPYQEKDSMFECGFHSFQQSRSPFNIAFFIYALLYLLLDLEVLLLFPFAVSGYVNNVYGLIITLFFIGVITLGFVYELGKGALKIPSKQYTYTIKNQPLIHISYIKTKSVKFTNPNPFITSSTLQSSILPFTISIKNIRKYLTFNNIIIGLISLIVMGLVKTLHIPTYILNFFNLENLEILEYIIAGIFGLVSRLGFRGIVEGIFVDNYATMAGEDPTQGSSSPLGSKIGDVGTTNTSNDDLPEKGSGSSDGNKQLESESSPKGVSDTQTQKEGESSSTNYSYEKYRAERYTKVYDSAVKNLVEEVKNLTLSMEKTEDDEEWKKLSDQRNDSMDLIKMVTQASTEEVKKLVSLDTNSTTTKRVFETVE